MGYMNYIDMNGDPQGNFTLVARKFNADKQKYGLYPIGTFTLNHNDTKLPVRFLYFYLLPHHQSQLRKLTKNDSFWKLCIRIQTHLIFFKSCLSDGIETFVQFKAYHPTVTLFDLITMRYNMACSIAFKTIN